MNSRHVFLSAFAFVLVVALAAPPVHAQTRSVKPPFVKNEVVSVAASATTPDQGRRRIAARRSRAHRLDSANAAGDGRQHQSSLGPGSTIKLDRTVFDDEHPLSRRRDQADLRRVPLRHRQLEKAAYKITTPLATIGVRGTILDVLAQRGARSTIKLQEGAATVCTTAFNASS